MSEQEPKKESEQTEVEKKQEDYKERHNLFIKEYGELVQKHGVDFASYPVFVPDGKGGFTITIQNTTVETKKHPVKSPFIAK
jgi:L-rhamnose mutarotase